MRNLHAKLLPDVAQRPACDVFINHRGSETKRTVVRLLYDHLSNIGVNAFLDTINLKPGDKLFDKIDKAIEGCKVGVAVFSPGYCDSYFCLHELALLFQFKKRVVPICYDVKPSELQVKDNRRCYSQKDLQRFRLAIEEAKYILGLSYDSSKGNWSELVREASDTVKRNLQEIEEEKKHMR